MTIPLDQFLSEINASKGITDISKALRTYYAEDKKRAITYPVVEALPLILYRTHISTIVEGLNKEISIADFKTILNAITNEEEEKVPPIALPYGCFMFNRSGENLYLNCYYRETKGEIKFDQRDAKRLTYIIPIPNIVLSFTLKRAKENIWQVMTVRYFCTPKTVTQLPEDIFITQPKGDQGLHRLPFPNMYTDHKMCYGGNTMPVRFTNNLRGLDYYYQILTQAPFNSDLGINGLTTSYSPKTWFEFLSTCKEFPYELLSKIN